MKVLIATPYFSPRIGGLELYAEAVARELLTAGWEVHVVTSGAQPGTEKYKGITIHRLRPAFVVSNTPVNPFWRWQLRRIIKDIAPDVINVHAPVPTMALAASAAAGRIPVVVTYHAGSMKKGRFLVDQLIATYESWLLPRMLNRATAIICASNFVRDTFLTQWAAKTTTITPGVDTDAFTPAVHQTAKGSVLFVGDFRDPRKGLEVLLAAIRKLPGVNLTVVGPGTPNPEPRVHYVGVKHGAELIAEFQKASLLVLPSTTEAESFGMVLLEAMACGLPVIGSRIGGIGSVIADGEDGLLVPPGDVTVLTQAIAHLTQNPKLAHQFGANGRRKVERNFTWHTRGAATAEILAAATTSGEVHHG